MKYFDKFIEVALVLLTASMTFIVTIQAIMRYSLGTTLFWGLELSRYLTVWIVMLGAALVLKERGHISIRVFVGKFLGRVRLWLDLLAHLLFLTFLSFFLYISIDTLPDQLDQGTMTLPVSMFWFYLALPVGGVLMILYLSKDMYKTMQCIRKNLVDEECINTCQYPECSVWMEEEEVDKDGIDSD